MEKKEGPTVLNDVKFGDSRIELLGHPYNSFAVEGLENVLVESGVWIGGSEEFYGGDYLFTAGKMTYEVSGEALDSVRKDVKMLEIPSRVYWSNGRRVLEVLAKDRSGEGTRRSYLRLVDADEFWPSPLGLTP